MSDTTRFGPHNGTPADGLAAAAIYLADPLGGEPALPSPADEAAQREAHVWQRLAELQQRHRRRLGRQLKQLGDRQAAVRALGARLVLARRALATAVRDNDAVHRRAPSPRYAYDELGRALSGLGLVVILSVCVLFDYLVDRSALQVLLLPLRVTQTFALFIAVVQTLSAHTIGTLLRRVKESPDPGALHHERWAMGVLGALVASTVVGLAAFRGMNGSVLFGLVMLGTGAATSVVATTASYLHASPRMHAVRTTGRGVRRSGNRVARLGRKMFRADARTGVAASSLQATAAAIAAQVEAIYSAQGVRLDGREPPWIGRVRRLADGDGLPATWGQ
jgi:hypothetical protein